MQNIYSSKFEGNFQVRPNGKSTDEESNKDYKSTLNTSSKKRMFVPMSCEKKPIKNYVSHSEINIHLCEDCGLTMFVCNDCKLSYGNLWEFKCNQCLHGSLCYDYLQNCNLYMVHGGQGDGYDYSQNCFLHFEHAGQDDNFVVDKTNISVIKSDENHFEMARSAETNDLKKIDWGNESSLKYFLMENQRKHAGIQSV